MKKIFPILGLAGLWVFLCSCASLKPRKIQPPSVQVQELGSHHLTQPVGVYARGSLSFGTRRIKKVEPWQWRRRDAIGAPMQSFTSQDFLGGDDLLVSTLGGGVGVWDLRAGEYRWKLDLPIGVASQPLVAGNSVFVAGMDAKVRKLRKSDGTQEWESSIGVESLGGIASAQGFLFVTAADDSLWALDEKTGRSLWTYKRPSPESSMYWSLRGQAIPLVSPDASKVYAGFSDGTFVCVEATSGVTLWERRFERMGRFKDVDTTAVMTADAKTIFVSVVEGEFLALKASDGSTLWSLGGASAAAPTLDERESVLYLSTSDSQLQKVSLRDGTLLWTLSLGAKGLGSKPILLGQHHLALTLSHGGLALVDRRTGTLVWQDSYGYGSLAPPSFDGKRLLALSARNVLHFYRVEERSSELGQSRN